MKMKKKWIFLAPLGILAMCLFVALGGLIVQQLWNWLLPPIFGFRLITFWQGLGMLALCRILFGSMGFKNNGSHDRGKKSGRWEAMTPEERERFGQGMRARCGFPPPASESTGQ